MDVPSTNRSFDLLDRKTNGRINIWGMTNRVERQERAYRCALEWCRVYGLTKDHIVPKYDWMDKRRKHIVGYYVLDETCTTTVATVDM